MIEDGLFEQHPCDEIYALHNWPALPAGTIAARAEWVAGDATVDLGERTHHYCLLALARKRLEDAARQIDPHAQGWIDFERFSKMLGLDSSHVNIQIFRARNQLMRAIPEWVHLPNIVERRRGGVRLGAFRFRIERGSAIEGEFSP